jgi:hypothetical protein
MDTNTNVQGIKSAALAAATELMSQATEASIGWLEEVKGIQAQAKNEIKAIQEAKKSCNDAHQLMVSNLNKAHVKKLDSYDEKIQAIEKRLNNELIQLEAKNQDALTRLKQSAAVTKTTAMADKVATKGFGFIGKGFGYVKSKLQDGARQ